LGFIGRRIIPAEGGHGRLRPGPLRLRLLGLALVGLLQLGAGRLHALAAPGVQLRGRGLGQCFQAVAGVGHAAAFDHLWYRLAGGRCFQVERVVPAGDRAIVVA
ncbi:hypothetical protein CEJ63_25275, partial [Acinetobacter baumannii]